MNQMKYTAINPKHKALFIIVALLLIVYLIFGTGLHGDDRRVISDMTTYSVGDFFSLDTDIRGVTIFGLPSFYGFWWTYYLLGSEYEWIYDLIKIGIHAISVYLVYRFASDYLSRDRALLASVLFIFYPLHDTTTYWFMTAPQHVLTPALILYCNHLIRHERYKFGIPLLFLAAFSNYSSPPYIFGLAIIFLIERQYKKLLIFVTPGFVYIFYYFWMKYNFIGSDVKIDSDLTVVSFLKNIIMQFFSLIESAIGPSYWLKVFYVIESIGYVSLGAVTILFIFVFIKKDIFSKTSKVPKSLYIGIISVLLFSFGMFALTGHYNHSVFNLGNRTIVYGSLFIAFGLAAFLPANRKSVIFLLIIFLVPVFGLSDHWKSWNSHQKIVIENIKNNQLLKEIEIDTTLLVTGNIYSKIGPFSHIEFFSMPWNVNAIFQDSVKAKNIVALTPYVKIEGDYIIDPKFGGKYSLRNKLYVYESENNLVRSISFIDVPDLIKQQPKIIRHWVQLFKDTWIQKIIVNLSPRLIYLFQ